MRLTTKSRYGTRMIIDIAMHEKDGPVHIRDVADRLELPIKYLEKIARDLRQAGFISSIRGPKGGYILNGQADKISIGMIVRLFEGESEFIRCGENLHACSQASICLTRPIWISAREAMYEKLDAISLGEVLRESPLSKRYCLLPCPC